MNATFCLSLPVLTYFMNFVTNYTFIVIIARFSKPRGRVVKYNSILIFRQLLSYIV